MRSGIRVGDITLAGLLEGGLGALLAGLITVGVGWLLFVHERNERRRERLHQTVIDLNMVARDHRALEYRWGDRQSGQDETELRNISVATILEFRHQLRIAISLARLSDRTLAEELMKALAGSMEASDSQEHAAAADAAFQTTKTWLLGHNEGPAA